MNIAQIKRIIKANTKKIQSFVVAGEGVYFVTYLPSGTGGPYKSLNKIRLALKKAGANVSRVIERSVKAGYDTRSRMTFRVDNDFEINCCFTSDDGITSLVVLNIVEFVD